MTATPAQRFGYIDAQRGLAALLVIWLHATDAFMQLPTPPTGGLLYKISAAIDTGRIGVILFFAISGFVIPSSLRAVGNQTTLDALRVFFIRRVFRLYPAYWVSVVAAALLGLFLMTPFSSQTVLLNLTIIQSVFGAPDVLGLYWTLRLELIFYIACALLFTFKVLQQPRWLVVGMFGGPIVFAVLPRCVHWLNPQWLNPASAGPFLNYLTEYGLFIAIMFWGALFRCWHDRAQADGTQHFSRVVLVVFILFALGICAAPLLTWMFYAYLPSALASKLTVFMPPVSLGLGLFILLSTTLKINHRVTTWLGEISYSMYLFHPIVFYTLFVLLRDGRLPWLAEAHLAVYLLLSVLGSIVLSALIYYAVEKPMMRLGRKLSGTLLA
ncbi:MAG: acyltransferase [Alcaligenaceae bacterium]|nr:acyltransferase [Alcaligenaceae bacterium]